MGTIYDGDVRISGNDDIIKIIPPELFKTEGKTFHMGKGYGFFIDCRKRYDDSDMLLSTVIIINIEYNNDLFDVEAKSHLKIKLIPIFQGDFVYIKRGEQKMINIRKRGENFFGYESYEKHIGAIFSGEDDEYIVAVPTIAGDWKFLQHNKYYITNAVALTSLYNVNQLNPYDAGYVAENDTGSFFSQTDFSYKGTFIQRGKREISEIGSLVHTAAAYSFDIADELVGLKSVFKAVPIASQVLSYIEFNNTIASLADSFKVTKTIAEKKIEYKPNYNNAAQQIATGGLHKDEAIAVQASGDNQLLIGTNDYVEFDYQIHCQDINVDTIFASMINLGFVEIYGTSPLSTASSDVYELSSTISDELKNHIHENYTEVPEIDLSSGGGEGQVNILPYNASYRLLCPTRSGKYDFSTSYSNYAGFNISEAKYSGEYVDVKDLNAPLYQSTNTEGIASITGAELQAGKKYLVEIDLKNKVAVDGIKGRYGLLDLNIAFNPTDLQLGNNVQKYNNVSSKYYQFNSSENLNYKFTVGSPNATIKVMDSDFNMIASASSGQIVATMSQWEKYYIEVSFPTTISGDISVHVADEMYVNLHNSYAAQAPQQVVVSSFAEVNLPEPPAHIGYTFDGWWTAEEFGNRVTNDNVLEIRQPTLNLYARWKPIQYKITYVENGGAAIPDGQYIIEHTATLNTSITRDSYVFMGWYQNADFTGEKVVAIPQGEIGDKTFYAKWVKASLAVSLDVNSNDTDRISADIDSRNATVAYGANYTLPTPTLDGFIFGGWYKGNVKYTGSDGHSIASCTDENDFTLVARWTREKYYIKADTSGGYKWLTKTGNDFTFSDSEAPIENQLGLCPNCFMQSLKAKYGVSATSPLSYLYKEGHIYQNLVKNKNDPTSIACWNALEFGADYADGSQIVIYADHKVEREFKIHVENGAGVNPSTIYRDFFGEIKFNQYPTKVGNTFAGWQVSNNSLNSRFLGTALASGQPFNYANMPDLSVGTEMDGVEIYISPVFSPNKYTVTFSGQSQYISPKQVTYGSIYNASSGNTFPVVSKTGHNFVGWYTAANGAGTKKVDSLGNLIGGWNIANNCTLYAYFVPHEYSITLNNAGGAGGTTRVTAKYGQPMPSANKPTKLGYTFNGYYTGTNGTGTQYYNANMQGVKNWTTLGGATLYAYWTITYHNILVDNGLYTENATAIYGQDISIRGGSRYAPTRTGYDFMGYFSEANGKGVRYFSSRIEKDEPGNFEMMMDSVKTWDFDNNGVIYAYWVKWEMRYNVLISPNDGTTLPSMGIDVIHEESITLKVPDRSGYTFSCWKRNGKSYPSEEVIFYISLYRNKVVGEICMEYGFYAEYSAACVAAGTQITLADGRQVPVETLTGNEMLLVWNLKTGRFDTAPIMFIDSDEAKEYKIINLYFSDGTQVKVISEHAFWDFDLNKYVFLREDAANYIGHFFNKQITNQDGQLSYTRVQLVNVVITTEYTTAWSPVTYSHLCYYVNGMLSMPGATTGLINIFTVDSDTMMYDSAAYLADISQYGLFAYEEFAEIFPIPEEMFNAFNAQYLKISIGKGLISYETLGKLIDRYVGLC